MPELTPGEFKAQMIERHRASFELWTKTHELLEGAVPLRRDVTPPYARALDILFVQQFKSHGSLYFLCVHGHGEDGATILRRMLEIAFQADYLSKDVPDRDGRAMKYLAWFWLQTEVRLKANIPDDQKTWWEEKYKAYKHLILGANGRPFRKLVGRQLNPRLSRPIGVGRHL